MQNGLFSPVLGAALAGTVASTDSNLIDALSHEAPYLMQREIDRNTVPPRRAFEARLKIAARYA